MNVVGAGSSGSSQINVKQINDKNYSLSIVLTAMDQKLQKS